MTNKDLITICRNRIVLGIRIGYCCHQHRNPKYLLFLGDNHGKYGWNWSAWFDNINDMIYISNYRNVPKEIYKIKKEIEEIYLVPDFNNID